MKSNIIMQTGVADKPENVEDTKIYENEQYQVAPHIEFIIKGALIAVVVLTLLAFTWKVLSPGSVSTSKDYIEIENVEMDLEE